MFDAKDLVPCAQCNDLVEFGNLDEKNICPDCAEDNALIDAAVGDEPDWLNESPAHWISSAATSFS